MGAEVAKAAERKMYLTTKVKSKTRVSRGRRRIQEDAGGCRRTQEDAGGRRHNELLKASPPNPLMLFRRERTPRTLLSDALVTGGLLRRGAEEKGEGRQSKRFATNRFK